MMLKNFVVNFLKIGSMHNELQMRNKGHLNWPHLRNPSWFLRKERKMRDNFVTPDNKKFVMEVVADNYNIPTTPRRIDHAFNIKPVPLVITKQVENASWCRSDRRTGVIARKIGLYPLWTKSGEKIQTTLLQLIDNEVVKYIPPEEYKPMHRPKVVNLNKFGCLLIGAENCNPTTLTKEYCNIFLQNGVVPKKHLVRFLVTPSGSLPSGTPLNVTHFRVGDYVDVRGKTIYRGFQGVVKRHGFKGMPASHGVTKTHRRPGNIGGGGEKGRVWPGTKMPGHMGNRWRKAKGLRIWRINTKYNVMWVQGEGIPGATNDIVYIYDSILPLRRHKTSPPFPTALNVSEEFNDIWYDTIHNFKDQTITFKPDE